MTTVSMRIRAGPSNQLWVEQVGVQFLFSRSLHVAAVRVLSADPLFPPGWADSEAFGSHYQYVCAELPSFLL